MFGFIGEDLTVRERWWCGRRGGVQVLGGKQAQTAEQLKGKGVQGRPVCLEVGLWEFLAEGSRTFVKWEVKPLAEWEGTGITGWRRKGRV